MGENLNPTISVIMPVYNCIDYIQEAVDSILNQTFSDFELIIIDDNSSDGTVDLIKKFNDPRIKLTLKTVNSGITNSLNYGLKIAKGKYIARMDGDDISFPDRFERQVQFMNLNPKVVLCGGGYISINHKKEFIPSQDHAELLFELTYYCPIAHPTVFIRKNILSQNKIEYDAKYEPAEDFRMWTILSRYGEIANIKEPLIQYRIHSNQTSITRAFQQKIISNIIAIEHVKYLSNNHEYFTNFIEKKIETQDDFKKYILVEEEIKKQFIASGFNLNEQCFLKREKIYLQNAFSDSHYNITKLNREKIIL
jgi:glycosyltransferase involved in cell wall biosynthesis